MALEIKHNEVYMDKKEMLKILKGYIYSEFGTAKKYAESLGVSSAFISAVLNGNKEPTEEMFKAISMKKKVIYCQA